MEGNDLLNSVMLFLPFYDREEVKRAIEKLQGEGGESKGAETGDIGDFQTLAVAKGKEKLLEMYKSLPTYATQDGRKIADIRRALRLAFELAFDGWDAESSQLRKKLRSKLLSIGEKRAKKAGLDSAVTDLATVRYRVLVVEDGIPKLDEEGEQKSLPITEQDVETLFTRSFLTLTEELSRSYVTARYDSEDANAVLWRCKLEVFLLSQDISVVKELEEYANEIVEEVYDKKKAQIRKLPTERQAAYKKITQLSRHFKATEPTVPMPLRLKTDTDATLLLDHLFVDAKNEFKAKLNTWEEPVLTAARNNARFLGWLRNYPRKSWSISYVYESKGVKKPGYPDFLVFREQDGHPVIDLMEPHRGEDSLAKAHGLCKFAEDHGDQFGRIEWIRIEGKQIQRLNLNSPAVRKEVLAANVDGALDALFKTIGTSDHIQF